MRYSALVTPQMFPGGEVSRPPIPKGFLELAFHSRTWNLFSQNPLDRTEYWTNENGEYTLEEAEALSIANVPADQLEGMKKKLFKTKIEVMP